MIYEEAGKRGQSRLSRGEETGRCFSVTGLSNLVGVQLLYLYDNLVASAL